MEDRRSEMENKRWEVEKWDANCEGIADLAEMGRPA